MNHSPIDTRDLDHLMSGISRGIPRGYVAQFGKNGFSPIFLEERDFSRQWKNLMEIESKRMLAIRDLGQISGYWRYWSFVNLGAGIKLSFIFIEG